MSNSYDFILWDWNGTLIDDVYVALNSVNDMLIKRKMNTIDIEQYYSYLDTPIIKFYEHLFDLNTIPFETIIEEFEIGYNKYIPERPVFKNAENILDKAKAKGIKQLVISASAQEKITSDARQWGIHKYFDVISGADNMNAESKITRAKNVLYDFGASPNKSIVIGDTLHDYYMAEELGARCILFSRGHQRKSDLLTTSAPVIDSLTEVEKFL